MNVVARTDTSLLGRWWWTVDRWTLLCLVALAGIGALLTLAASPPVAERLGFEPYHFARRQFVFLPSALLVIFGVSLLSPKGVRRLATLLLAVSLLLLAFVPVIGVEVKGAARWLSVAGLTLQPSEFVKPGFAVMAAWMMAEAQKGDGFPGTAIAGGLFAAIAALLLAEPDVGQTTVVAGVWGLQLFLAGLPLLLVLMLGVLFLGGGVGAYFVFDHVQARVDRFLDPSIGGGYQVSRGLDAFRNGGWFGTGPGEGRVKDLLPDAHADFIFAVAGEEFGLIACLILLALFAFVVLRGFARAFGDDDLFRLLAVVGLLAQLGMQAAINMASAIHLIPPKGMTLPFVSYGGSSTLALALGMGMVLALTRRRASSGGPS